MMEMHLVRSRRIMTMRLRAVTLSVVTGAAIWLEPSRAAAAQTPEPLKRHQTSIVLKLDSPQPLAIHSSFHARPPTITIDFPLQRVVGALPEHSVVGRGIVKTISARYYKSAEAAPKRFLQSLDIALSSSYPYQVRSEPGRVVISIDHPAAISNAAMEVGLRGGTIIQGLSPLGVSERFRAMQEALAKATPSPWALRVAPSEAPLLAPARVEPSAQASAINRKGVSIFPEPAPWRAGRSFSAQSWILFGLLITIIGAVGVWAAGRWGTVSLDRFRKAPAGMLARRSSGVGLVDQLVWRAFERQGYQLVAERELHPAPGGVLRVVAKEEKRFALFCVGGSAFFEKRAVERFLRAMREVRVEQGFLVAAGSFTIPAQRFAKEHQITLIGREQLTELLSAGATSEYVTKQLEQQQARLEEAKETVQQYASELDNLRRQRNEASWYLGEERAKSAKLDAQLAELEQQMRHQEAELARWEQESSKLRKQWEESQWYLGEAQVRAQHLETQLTLAQGIAQEAERAKREREEANWYLGEERTKRESLEKALADLQQRLEDSLSRERNLQEALGLLKLEIEALRTYGERRAHARARIPQALVELREEGDETNGPLFSGAPRNISSSGIGVEIDRELPLPSVLRLRLNLLGLSEPIDSKVAVVWQRVEERSPRSQSGCRFIDLPAAGRTLIEELVGQQQ
jgi:hypothetical protein